MALRRNDQSLARFLACFEKPTSRLFISYRAILESFFYAYSVIVESFVIVFVFVFFSWETLHSAVLSLTNMLRLCQMMPICWSRWLLFSVWKTVYLQLHLYTAFFVTPQLRISWLARKLWLSGLIRASKINVGLEPGSGLWLRSRAGPGFKMRPFYNSVWICRQEPTRGRLKGYVLHPPTVKIEWNHFVK